MCHCWVINFNRVSAAVRPSVDEPEHRAVNIPLSIAKQKLDCHVPNTPSFSFSVSKC